MGTCGFVRRNSRNGLLTATIGPGHCFGFAALLALLPVTAAHAVNCTAVTSDATMATAIDAVNDGLCDTINITQNITLSATNLPVIDRIGANVTIQSTGGTHTLSGSNNSRLIAILNGNLTVQNLVIQDGLAKGGDGGSETVSG